MSSCLILSINSLSSHGGLQVLMKAFNNEGHLRPPESQKYSFLEREPHPNSVFYNRECFACPPPALTLMFLCKWLKLPVSQSISGGRLSFKNTSGWDTDKLSRVHKQVKTKSSCLGPVGVGEEISSVKGQDGKIYASLERPSVCSCHRKKAATGPM